MEQISFYLAALAAILSAWSVILQRRVMYSVLSLIVTLLSVAWIYAMLNASFLAIVQVILYAGAIVVLFVFAVMMLRFEDLEPGRLRPGLIGCLGLIVALFFMGELLLPMALLSTPAPGEVAPVPDFGSIKSIGGILYTQYIIPLELVTVLLIVAVVGALLLSQKG